MIKHIWVIYIVSNWSESLFKKNLQYEAIFDLLQFIKTNKEYMRKRYE